MEDYKSEIVQSRVGSLGSSDGKILLQIAQLGSVPKSAYKRLAVCKGLIEHEDIPRTAAIKAGDEIEMLIYEHLKARDERWQSNPLLVSEKYSRPNCKLISHIDFMLKNEYNKELDLYECKATHYTFEQTRDIYKAQLFIHHLLGNEMISKLGKGWKMKLHLVHYDTNGLDLENDGVTFDPERLTVKALRMPKTLFDMGMAMDIVNDFLETFTEYYGDGEEVDADLLPEKVKTQFDEIANVLTEIKCGEDKVKAFKERLFAFMNEKGIKSIKNDVFSITRVDESESHSFDYKKFLDDQRLSHPITTKRLEKKYDKVTKKKGYVNIKVKESK